MVRSFVLLFMVPVCALRFQKRKETPQWTSGRFPLVGHTVDVTKFPSAVCLNGEPARYFIGRKPGVTGPGFGWAMFLQGGGACASMPECTSRAKGPRGKPLKDKEIDSYKVHLCDEVTEMADYTRVYVPYCGGDSHAGNATVNGIHFGGRPIIEAILDDLVVKHGLESASVFVLTGASAGGIGTFLNADYVKRVLDPFGIKVAAIPQSGLLYRSAFKELVYPTLGLDFDKLTQPSLEFQNQMPNEACWKAMGKPNPGRFECQFFDSFIQYVDVPLFMVVNRWDSHDQWAGSLLKIKNAGERQTAVKQWGDMHESFFQQLISGDLPGVSANVRSNLGFFIPACIAHSNTPDGSSIEGVSKGQAIGAWLQKQLKGWGLLGGKWKPASAYQLISDAAGHEGKCSATCCTSKCTSTIGCVKR